MFLDGLSNLDEIAEHILKPVQILETASLHVRDWHQSTLAIPSIFIEAILSPAKTLTFRGATLSPVSCRLSQLTEFTFETHIVASVLSAILLDTLERMPLLRIF